MCIKHFIPIMRKIYITGIMHIIGINVVERLRRSPFGSPPGRRRLAREAPSRSASRPAPIAAHPSVRGRQMV